MNKKNIIGKIKNIYDEEEMTLTGNYVPKDNKFYLYDQNNNKIIIDLTSKSIIKENDETKTELFFREKEITTCTYLLKESKESVDLKIHTTSFIADHQNLFISYEVLNGDERFPFEIKIF
jgi:hypothetical protein